MRNFLTTFTQRQKILLAICFLFFFCPVKNIQTKGTRLSSFSKNADFNFLYPSIVNGFGDQFGLKFLFSCSLGFVRKIMMFDKYILNGAIFSSSCHPSKRKITTQLLERVKGWYISVKKLIKYLNNSTTKTKNPNLPINSTSDNWWQWQQWQPVITVNTPKLSACSVQQNLQLFALVRAYTTYLYKDKTTWRSLLACRRPFSTIALWYPDINSHSWLIPSPVIDDTLTTCQHHQLLVYNNMK